VTKAIDAKAIGSYITANYVMRGMRLVRLRLQSVPTGCHWILPKAMRKQDQTWRTECLI